MTNQHSILLRDEEVAPIPSLTPSGRQYGNSPLDQIINDTTISDVISENLPPVENENIVYTNSFEQSSSELVRIPHTSSPEHFTDKECVICYESLSTKKNLCITECGHEFCFSCMMKHVQRNNGCPICRSTIIDDIEDSESDTDGHSESIGSDSEEYSDEESVEENEEYPIEQLVSAFTEKGYGLKDALSMLMYRFSKTDEKYNKSYITQLEKDLDDMNDDLQSEFEERNNMVSEDTNMQVQNV